MGYVVTPAFDPNKAEADGSLQLKASLIYIATVYCKFQDNQGYIEGPCPLKKKKDRHVLVIPTQGSQKDKWILGVPWQTILTYFMSARPMSGPASKLKERKD